MLIIYQCLCLQMVVLPAGSQKYQLVHISKHCQIVNNLKLHFEIVSSISHAYYCHYDLL